MEKGSSTIRYRENSMANVLVGNIEWRRLATQAISWYSIIDVLPFNVKLNMEKRDEIVELDSPNKKLSIKGAWGHLRSRK